MPKKEEFHPDTVVVLEIDNGNTVTYDQLVKKGKNHPHGPGYTAVSTTVAKPKK